MSDWVSSFPEAEEARSKAATLAAKKRAWVPGGENTAQELLDMERQRKADFLAREQRRAAA